MALNKPWCEKIDKLAPAVSTPLPNNPSEADGQEFFYLRLGVATMRIFWIEAIMFAKQAFHCVTFCAHEK
ncbi:MAG TPA: hypothetical protein VEX60_04310 [Pyrinomonadaceae bacterium]|nr:hypothetical protein [Pyrinomonadaceae bacterium]